MLNIKNTFSRFKRNARNRITNIKNKAQNASQKFKENVHEAKNKPRSKRKSLFLGFTTILGIFGVALLAPALPAVANDLPQKAPNPGCPATSDEIMKAFAGAAATICGLAVTSGSFMIGAVCGVIVVVGILKAQGR